MTSAVTSDVTSDVAAVTAQPAESAGAADRQTPATPPAAPEQLDQLYRLIWDAARAHQLLSRQSRLTGRGQATGPVRIDPDAALSRVAQTQRLRAAADEVVSRSRDYRQALLTVPAPEREQYLRARGR